MSLRKICYILGHKNPDADSVCAAVGYEHYKKAIGQGHCLAGRCGTANARIEAIFKRFSYPVPPMVGDVTPRVMDIMNTEIVSLRATASCAEALGKLDNREIRAIPVVSEDGKAEGVISIHDLGDFFTPSEIGTLQMRHVKASLSSIVKTLKAKVLNVVDPYTEEDLYIRIGAMDIRSFGKFFDKDEEVNPENSIIIVGDRWDIQEKSLQSNVRLLIVTGGLEIDEDMIERAKERNVSLISSPLDSATTALMVRTATSIGPLMSTHLVKFSPKEKLERVRKKVAALNNALFMVVDEKDKLLGVFSKTDLLKPVDTQIILVDHNEISQAVNGADQVNIMEIIDHHRLGNIPTRQPILFINRPVGSSCTIIADMFKSDGLLPDKNIAGILMSGIISDTLNLKSPTTTDVDVEILAWLSNIAEEDSNELSEMLFNSGSVILTSTPNGVIESDCKIYEESGVRYSVSQIEELGFENFRKKEDILFCALGEYREKEALNLSVLLVTNVNTQNSHLMVSGGDGIVERIPYSEIKAGKIYDLPGVVSRKKQLIPLFSGLLSGVIIE